MFQIFVCKVYLPIDFIVAPSWNFTWLSVFFNIGFLTMFYKISNGVMLQVDPMPIRHFTLIPLLDISLWSLKLNDAIDWPGVLTRFTYCVTAKSDSSQL